MASEERKENRYQRRKLKRKAKRDKLLSKYDSFYNVINRDALAEAANDARKGISWKGSVKRFHLRLIYNIAMLNNKLMYHKDIRKGFVCFYLYERGKKRDIMSVHFSERVVQKSFCKNAAIPILTHNLVYDNGASQKGKGTQFSVNRLKTHLHREYRRNGNNGYILLIDFSGYFANIQHEPLKKQLAKAFSDSSLLWLSYQFVDAYYDYNLKNGIDEHVGLGLGGEPNQAYAVSFPNSIDHFIKEQLHIKGFGAYMDDRYLIHKDKEYLKYCLEEIRKQQIVSGYKKLSSSRTGQGNKKGRG
ncbi:MAG: hypothetical protein IJ141_10690 [Lachnospiraceae bacterium]|nr:hypothetical protein [Lachnospiraceae bacterium]